MFVYLFVSSHFFGPTIYTQFETKKQTPPLLPPQETALVLESLNNTLEDEKHGLETEVAVSEEHKQERILFQNNNIEEELSSMKVKYQDIQTDIAGFKDCKRSRNIEIARLLKVIMSLKERLSLKERELITLQIEN